MSSPIRVRFAPSPTGYLHVGGARTALFNYFWARAQGGKFVLRIEDTDTERNKPEFEAEILESMRWLGMEWDEGPFYQSQRFDLYRKSVWELVAKNEAYKCYCTPAEVDAMRAKAQAEGRKPMYDRRCRDLAPGDTGGKPKDSPFVVRFKTPLTGEVLIDDLIKGEVRFDVVEIDDFVILRTNDAPIYNFTVVVDDVDMKITHVLRAEEHLNNTPKQILLMRALGYPVPRYAHVPLVLAPDRTKLSKRHGAVSVTQYKRDGYLKEALVNYLARLGWSAGDQEFFTAAELERTFDPSGCGSSGAVFDRAKLDWLNGHYIKQKTPAELAALVLELYQLDLKPLLANPSGEKLMLALRERAVKLTDFVSGTAWYLSENFERDAHSVEAALTSVKPGAIEALIEGLRALADDDFRAEKIAPVFKEAATKIGGKMPDVAKPARVLLTGTLASPDIGLVVEALGRERAIARLQRG